MHAISSYRGNRPTNKQTQTDRGDYNTLRPQLSEITIGSGFRLLILPAVEHYWALASTKLYCLTTESHARAKIVQSREVLLEYNPWPLNSESDAITTRTALGRASFSDNSWAIQTKWPHVDITRNGRFLPWNLPLPQWFTLPIMRQVAWS